MIKQRLFKTTPFFVFSILGLLGVAYELIIERGGPEGWGYLAIYSILPIIVAMILVDVVLKLVIKTSIKWVWAIEVILCLGLIYYWIVT